MKYSLTTSALLVLESRQCDRMISFSAGNFSTAVSVYLQWANTRNVFGILNAAGKSQMTARIPAGNRVEAYTDAGTADLAVAKMAAGCQENT